jgi:ribosomal protein S1
MSKTETLGKIAFINHEKNYAMVEYEHGGKKKTVKGSLDPDTDGGEKGSKKHNYLIGDIVSFNLKSTKKGERMMAANINFLYNNALDVLLNKAMTNNQFTGYLKFADGKYFIKEIDSYIFFPLNVSAWQIMPAEDDMEDPVEFTLQNMEHKERITASLLNNEYIPEFKLAVKHFKSKKPVTATITKISPHGIYVNLFDDKIKAKIALAKNEKASAIAEKSKVGDTLEVMINHIGKSRMVVDVAEKDLLP